MLVALDAGNTHTVVGVYEGDRRVASWRLSTRPEGTVDEYGLEIRILFDLAGLKAGEVDG